MGYVGMKVSRTLVSVSLRLLQLMLEYSAEQPMRAAPCCSRIDYTKAAVRQGLTISCQSRALYCLSWSNTSDEVEIDQTMDHLPSTPGAACHG